MLPSFRECVDLRFIVLESDQTITNGPSEHASPELCECLVEGVVGVVVVHSKRNVDVLAAVFVGLRAVAVPQELKLERTLVIDSNIR